MDENMEVETYCPSTAALVIQNIMGLALLGVYGGVAALAWTAGRLRRGRRK